MIFSFPMFSVRDFHLKREMSMARFERKRTLIVVVYDLLEGCIRSLKRDANEEGH